MPDPIVQINSSSLPAPDEVSGRTFSLVRRGFDPVAVRRFLEEVAGSLREAASRENSLRMLLEDARARADSPNLDEATLSAAVGAETGRVLQVAHEAAHELVQKAEARAATLVENAQASADERLRVANHEASTVATRARSEADTLIGSTKQTCMEMVEEARAVRRRILGDLAERRRSLHSQLEQLRAGKDSLAQVVDAVAGSVDAIRDRLTGAEDEARGAADIAMTRHLTPDEVTESLDELVAKAVVTVSSINGARGAGSRDHEVILEDRIGRDFAGYSDVVRVGAEPLVPEAGLSLSSLDELPTVDHDATLTPSDFAPTDADAIAFGPTPQEVVLEASSTSAAVEELFAKIRANRAEELDRARAVLGQSDAPDEQALQVQAPLAEVTGREVEQVPPSAPVAAQPLEDDSATADDDGADGAGDPLFVLRDQLIEQPFLQVSRSLKRALSSEQNELLDAIRHLSKTADVASLFDEEAGVDRLALACASSLAEAFRAGVHFGEQTWRESAAPDAKQAGRGDVSVIEKEASVAGDEVGRALAREIVTSVGRRVRDGLTDAGRDQGALSMLVGNAYRDWKGTRVEAIAGDFATLAFARGTRTFASLFGIGVSWVVDESGAECGDCVDNALAGGQSAGHPFPTGQSDPPAHPGCRCVLVPASL